MNVCQMRIPCKFVSWISVHEAIGYILPHYNTNDQRVLFFFQFPVCFCLLWKFSDLHLNRQWLCYTSMIHSCVWDTHNASLFKAQSIFPVSINILVSAIAALWNCSYELSLTPWYFHSPLKCFSTFFHARLHKKNNFMLEHR